MKSKRFELFLIFGFSLVLALLLAISYIGVSSLVNTRNIFDRTYNHNFSIITQVEKANTNLIGVHRGMKDIVLSRTQKSFQDAVLDVNFYDTAINNNFTEIKLLLGNNILIAGVEKAYSDWAPIRQQTINFWKNKQFDLAANNTRTKGAAQVSLISEKLNILDRNITNSAELAFQQSKELSTNSIWFLMLTSLFAVILVLLIAGIVSRMLLQYKNQLHDEKEMYRVTIDSIGDGVITVDMNRNIRNINKIAQKFTGWTFAQALNKKFSDVFNITNENPDLPIKNPIEEVIKSDRIFELENHTILTSKNGQRRHIADSAAPIKNANNKTVGVVIVFRDVSEEIKHLDEVSYLSFHDSLTGLFNRNHFNLEMVRFAEEKYLPLSIVMGDVNGLKLSNDVYGHEMGDALLIQIAEVLTENSRENDVVARLGGDEFAIIQPNTNKEESLIILEKIKITCEQSDYNSISIKPIIASISLGTFARTSMDQSMNFVFKNAEDRMYTHKLLEGRSVRSTIISSLRNTLLERNFETEKHAMRMMQMANDMGTEIGFSKYDLDEMKLLTLLHDIGKIGISDSILNKPDKLTSEEWIEMKKHPEIGYRIAQSTPELAHISDLILSHHEHWDGTGYPLGLAGENIPLLSRLLSIIDAYDVMIHDRPYKTKMSNEEAVEEIRKCAGTQFDPKLAKIFVEKVIGSSWEV